MTQTPTFEILLVTAPGLETLLAEEAREKGFDVQGSITGGVTLQGTWEDVWRANLDLRGAGRVLARIGSFMAFHLAQLDKRARKFPWSEIFDAQHPIKVEVTSKKSKIYHAGAATQRIETALKEELGATISQEAEITLKVRIDDNLCTFSVDTSGESLHKRGHKEAVGKAPMRENLAALFLRQCGYSGSETVVDPMCGSGTFVIEAAEIALGLQAGRNRHFAFEKFANFDPERFAQLRRTSSSETSINFYGSDRDQGAVRMSMANAERAGVAKYTHFRHSAVSDLERPVGPAGLVIVNPPYGARIGDRKLLFSVYGALGKTLMERFKGWRVGMITSDAGLAKSSGLPFLPVEDTVSHGGLRISLFRTDPL